MPTNYYFIVCPNNSGTTIMSQYLAAQTGAYLPPFGNNEGQMAPGVKAHMRKNQWNERHKFDWPFIRSEWDKLRDDMPFVEVSPPNIMRVSAIREEFGRDSKLVFGISSPYMQIASCLFNYFAPPVQVEHIKNLAQTWVKKATVMRRNVEDNPDVNLVRYEDFCADPANLNRALGIEVRNDWTVEGKRRTKIGRIDDRTHHTTLFMSADEMQNACDILASETSLLEFFGYPLKRGEDVIFDGAPDPLALHAGIFRRMKWEAGSAGRRRRKAAGNQTNSHPN